MRKVTFKYMLVELFAYVTRNKCMNNKTTVSDRYHLVKASPSLTKLEITCRVFLSP